MKDCEITYDVNEVRRQITENNKEISKLLYANEELLRNIGFKPPARNMALDDDNKIQLPSDYIRTKEYFIKKYRLREFFDDPVVLSNVAYSLQMSDMYNYLVNRFNVYGSVGTMVYKAATINCVCVIESLMGQVLDDVHAYCKECKSHNGCKYFIKKKQQFSNKLDAIQEHDMLRLMPEEYQVLRNAYRLRNHMHIYSAAKENEHTSKAFDKELYNDTIELMKKVTVSLYNNVLPGTKGCYKEFIEK